MEGSRRVIDWVASLVFFFFGWVMGCRAAIAPLKRENEDKKRSPDNSINRVRELNGKEINGAGQLNGRWS